MSKYIITAELDQQWFDILGQITRHQPGFCWIEVKKEEESDELKEWLLDRQENGDDGTGFGDYDE